MTERKSTKWLVAILIALLMVFGFGFVSVSADIIMEPDDDFYRDHMADCHYEDRAYLANGVKGLAHVYESPENSKIKFGLDNGLIATVLCIYEDSEGIQWGFVDTEKGGGWLMLDEVLLVYDCEAFMDEHYAEITNVDTVLSDEYAGEEINYWEYPGAAEPDGTITCENEEPVYISHCYTDEKGHQWGYFGYYFGCKSKWVCMDDAQADYEDLYQVAPSTEVKLVDANSTLYPASTEKAETSSQTVTTTGSVSHPNQISPISFILIGLVVAVVVIAVVFLIVWMIKSHKES